MNILYFPVLIYQDAQGWWNTYIKLLTYTQQNARTCVIVSTVQYTIYNNNNNHEIGMKGLHPVFILCLTKCFRFPLSVSFGSIRDILPCVMNWIPGSSSSSLSSSSSFCFPAPPPLPVLPLRLLLSPRWFIQTWSPHSKHSTLIRNHLTAHICTCDLSI